MKKNQVTDFGPTWSQFTVLSWSSSDFHLKTLETIYILTYTPSLCKQRQCLFSLNVITIYHSPLLSYIFIFFPNITDSIFPNFLNRCPSLTETR